MEDGRECEGLGHFSFADGSRDVHTRGPAPLISRMENDASDG
jgi:hypothetical protein